MEVDKKPTEEKKQPAARAVPAESRYTMAELIGASKTVLGVPRECAVAAFKDIRKDTMTVNEAKEIVNKFMKKEVR